MSKKTTAKSSIAQSKKKSPSTKRIKSVSFKSSPWYAMAAARVSIAASAAR